MIENLKQLQSANEALVDLYKVIRSLRKDYAKKNPAAFALLSEGPMEEIDRIRREIDEFTGVTLAARELSPIWIRLSGANAVWHNTRASVLSDYLDAFRKGIQSTAKHILSGKISGPPLKSLRHLCDPFLENFQPGSFQVGLRFPEADLEQMEMFQEDCSSAVQKALSEYFLMAEWVASDADIAVLKKRFDSETRRRVLLKAVKPLVPSRSGGIDFVELSGSAVPTSREIVIYHSDLDRIENAMEYVDSDKEDSFEGIIREMDLDKKKFILRKTDTVNEVLCSYDDSVDEPGNYLNKRVRVYGIVKQEGDKPRLTVSSIYLLDDGDK